MVQASPPKDPILDTSSHNMIGCNGYKGHYIDPNLITVDYALEDVLPPITPRRLKRRKVLNSENTSDNVFNNSQESNSNTSASDLSPPETSFHTEALSSTNETYTIRGLTIDHNCRSATEIALVKRLSSDPQPVKSGTDGLLRVAGSLAITRALGDGYLKRAFLR